LHPAALLSKELVISNKKAIALHKQLERSLNESQTKDLVHLATKSFVDKQSLKQLNKAKVDARDNIRCILCNSNQVITPIDSSI
jgi:hypothetical protein